MRGNRWREADAKTFWVTQFKHKRAGKTIQKIVDEECLPRLERPEKESGK
jgi:hypothetical protein